MNVEIGAGTKPYDGYVAVDVNPRTAQIVADAQHLPFKDHSVGSMRAVDVLEHISYRDTDTTLQEWARVCKPGASLYVQVPDAATIMGWYDTGDPRLYRWEHNQKCAAIRGAEWRLLGGHLDGDYATDGDDFRWNAHFSLWDQGSLTDALGRSGFKVVKVVSNGHPNLLCDAVRY